MVPNEIKEKLKSGPEQQLVVGPLVSYLVELGWKLDQIFFGKNEWKVPKTPSEASKREKGTSFDYFPVDIAVFDDPKNCGDYRHLLFVIECKQPDIDVGLQQLETYLSLEPHVKLGVWANNADISAPTLSVYKDSAGLSLPKKSTVIDIPSYGSSISPTAIKLTFEDLVIPTKDTLYKAFSDLLDAVVAQDGNVTRREEQLDQLCNLILLKLDSDKAGKIDPKAEVAFRELATEKKTAEHIKQNFKKFIEVYPDIFITNSDKEVRFDDGTILNVVEKISKYNFIEIGADTVSIAFQVLRSAALKQEEGQYFTPKQVIQAAIKMMDLNLQDIIIDPACGTGGFLVQALVEMKDRYPTQQAEISRWAQLHLHGIDKDAIGIKLTKAIMQILGDGSAHCVRGDSVLTHTWPSKYPHLLTNNFKNGRFTKIFTNPPFGAPLKIKYRDAKKAGLSITEYVDNGKDIELGLLMFNRCCDLLAPKGRMCIVLPETYFFSPSYKYVRNWVKERLKPICVANVPMDAFQGFCRAKTNLYIFEKLDEDKTNLDVEHDVVSFMNPQTCGIYKNGSDRFVVDASGQRTDKIDNQLLDLALVYASDNDTDIYKVPLKRIYEADVLVPNYYDAALQKPFEKLQKKYKFEAISIGTLCDKGIITVANGHGSPSNDLRNGCIPYVKVSDIRNMRINVNPTNLISEELAKRFWKTGDGKSDLKGWDLISPSRASSNIGEFAILVPGEEQIVLTKEVFVVRVNENDEGFSPFYLLWALSLVETRKQWQRVTLMQTNREDVGQRYKEILIPIPISKEWADKVSNAFKKYFEGIAEGKKEFVDSTAKDDFTYIASVSAFDSSIDDNDTELN
ncbi:N-6 DNA methylase [Stomatobaculum longum]|jgi:N-6 DNA methylase|uniref:N-6 DNA methylase n=1 Tax=Stomatobaculum longum TaxID=796942 RepID=UPI0028E20D14|nr:N-6 DNA methylase [Stomatobaculum longum]